MKNVKFSASINAPKEKVWATLWDDSTYRKWTVAFSADSHAVSDWNEGSSIKFIDDKGDGISSMIETKIPYQQMSFKHLGELKDGAIKSDDWAGSMENYFLAESDGRTELNVDVDIMEEYEEYFLETFPKAMAAIKQISEND